MAIKRRHAVHERTVNADDDIFLHSLDEITPEQLGDTAVSHKRTGSELVSFIIERGVYFFAVAVFAVCVIELVLTLREQLVGDAFYEQVSEQFSMSYLLAGNDSPVVKGMTASESAEPFVAGVSQPDSGITIEVTEYDETVEALKAHIASLSRQYPDVYAWIHIPDTVIDYPVVRGEDNRYYLDHAFTGEPLSYGSIYADHRLKDYILDNYNIVLFGHNSQTGKMFADIVKKFAHSNEFFQTHNIYIYTATGLYEFEPFNMSVFSYDYQYFRVRFSGGEDFLSFVDEMTQNSIYKKNLTFDENDRILTLSTCTDLGIDTLRYCLQAKLVRVVE